MRRLFVSCVTEKLTPRLEIVTYPKPELRRFQPSAQFAVLGDCTPIRLKLRARPFATVLMCGARVGAR